MAPGILPRIPWIPWISAPGANQWLAPWTDVFGVPIPWVPWISAPARVPLVEMLAISGIPAFPHFSLPEATPANGAGPIVVRPLMCWPLARASGQHIRGRTTIGPAPFAGVASGSEKCGKAGIPEIASISTRGTLAGAEIQGTQGIGTPKTSVHGANHWLAPGAEIQGIQGILGKIPGAILPYRVRSLGPSYPIG